MMKSAAAFVLVSATLLSAHQPAREGGASAPSYGRAITAAGFDDDNESMLYDSSPRVFLKSHSNRAVNSDWMRFETDGCGFLRRVDNRHSMVTRSALGDDLDILDEDDPSNKGRALIGQWLSQHSEIAVINDGVDKSCDDAEIVDSDGDTFEIA